MGGVIHIRHVLRASEVVAVVIRRIAWGWCAFGLHHIARVSGHVRGEVLFRTCVVHSMMFV